MVGMGGVAFESSQTQAGPLFGFERAVEIVRQIQSLGDGAILQSDVAGMADAETVCVARFNRLKHPGRTVVKDPAFVFPQAIQFHAHVSGPRVLDAAVRRAVDADAVPCLAR